MKEFKFKIYQIDRNAIIKSEMDLLSMSLPKEISQISLKERGYKEVYSSYLESEQDQILENLYYIFNVNHPKNYKGRSLSVSDIVKIDEQYYYCDLFGWKKIKCS